MNPGVFCDNKDYVCFLNDYKCIISLVIMNEMQHSVFLLCLLAQQDMRYLMYSWMLI